MKTFPQTNGGRLLARGDTYDYECSRTTSRLVQAHSVLRVMDALFTRVHGTTIQNDGFDWATKLARHQCTSACGGSWPEWVEGDLLDQVYAAADKAVTARGSFNRNPVKVS